MKYIPVEQNKLCEPEAMKCGGAGLSTARETAGRWCHVSNNLKDAKIWRSEPGK
jgi:hypothetical protein